MQGEPLELTLKLSSNHDSVKCMVVFFSFFFAFGFLGSFSKSLEHRLSSREKTILFCGGMRQAAQAAVLELILGGSFVKCCPTSYFGKTEEVAIPQRTSCGQLHIGERE